MVDEVMDADVPLHENIPMNDVDVEDSDGIAVDVLKLMKTFFNKYSRGSYLR